LSTSQFPRKEREREKKRDYFFMKYGKDTSFDFLRNLGAPFSHRWASGKKKEVFSSTTFFSMHIFVLPLRITTFLGIFYLSLSPNFPLGLAQILGCPHFSYEMLLLKYKIFYIQLSKRF